MTPRFIEWIWHVKGSLPLAPAQSSDEAFERLDPLFQTRGTTYERSGDRLTFSKTNIAPQDRMSVFEGGYLQVEENPEGPVLRYNLKSKALLFCFLAPLLFLAFAQLTIAVGNYEKQKAAAEAAANEDKKDEKKEDPAEKYASVPLHPIDKFLGAPEPEKPKKDEKKEKEKKDRGPSPTPAYVFAGIFATLYIVGRILEAWLIKKRFRQRLLGA